MIDLEQVFYLVRRAPPFHELPRSVFESVVDLLAGRYPSDEFAELRPRLNWDRIAGTLLLAAAVAVQVALFAATVMALA